MTVGLYALAVYNVVKVIGSRMTSGAAMAWIILNLTLPVVGVPLYLLLGDFRIKGYVKRHRAATAELESDTPLPALETPPEPGDLPEAIRSGYVTFRTLFAPFGPTFVPQRGHVTLLLDGQTTFRSIFAAVESAERYILVQYYIVRSDRLGLELKRLLIERARSGIPVYLLCDDMGSFWLSRDSQNEPMSSQSR
jgi:cardiolipin synthase